MALASTVIRMYSTRLTLPIVSCIDNPAAVLKKESVKDKMIYLAIPVCKRMDIDALVAILTGNEHWIDFSFVSCCLDVGVE